MNTIEAKLTAEFATFKVDYLNQVEDWAIATQAHFKALENEYMSISVPRPKQVLKREAHPILGTYSFYERDFSEMTEEQVQLWKRQQELNEILYKCTFPFGMSTDKLVETQRIAASKWFDASVAKLAAKIQDKGINAETMTISNSYVDRNLNTLITDGEKKVKAQTIFANGAIKRPHFRYLIK